MKQIFRINCVCLEETRLLEFVTVKRITFIVRAVVNKRVNKQLVNKIKACK
jgi:hypothetical protein